MLTVSLLDKLLNRLLAQRLAFEWAFQQIARAPGPVFELGMGKGRTFSHLKLHLPERQIFVFDRDFSTARGEAPARSEQVQGSIEETLPGMAERFCGQVILANSDVGERDKAHNRFMARTVSGSLPKAMAPGGIVLSDLDLTMPGFAEVPLPQGAPPNAYHIYQRVS